MKTLITLLGYTLFLIFVGCVPAQIAQPNDDGLLQVKFVQINDVYEISAINNGREGGMARIATLKQQERNKNPNTFLVVAGDFLSPSVFNNLSNEGKRIRGAQMVDAFNAAGVDFVIPGNHEFDFGEKEFQERINESRFTWIASNVFHQTENGVQRFRKSDENGEEEIPEEVILNLTDDDGTSATIGIFSLILPFNKADYVHYDDVFTIAEQKYKSLAEQCDAVIAITHLDMQDDLKLAEKLPSLALIMGGHEHDGRFSRIGSLPISKAQANARTAYINTVLIDKNNSSFVSTNELIQVNESIEKDAATQAVVDKWMNIATESYSTSGFNSQRVIQQSGKTYDVLETSVREKPTNFSKMVVRAMEKAASDSQFAFINAGAMRLDDYLNPPVTEYDILRAMPYGGKIIETEITGDLLLQVLNAGISNITKGGYLHFSENLTPTTEGWNAEGKPIDPEGVYRVAFADFLIAGLEMNLDFLNPENPKVLQIKPDEPDPFHPKNDIRRAVIQLLDD